MEQRTLNFAEAPVQVLTLDELEKSYHENLPTGDPVGGIYHFALIQKVLETFEQRGLQPVVQEIFAADMNNDVQITGIRHQQKSVNGYNSLPNVFTRENVARCFGYNKDNSVTKKISRLIQNHQIEEMDGDSDGKYRKLKQLVL